MMPVRHEPSVQVMARVVCLDSWQTTRSVCSAGRYQEAECALEPCARCQAYSDFVQYMCLFRHEGLGHEAFQSLINKLDNRASGTHAVVT